MRVKITFYETKDVYIIEHDDKNSILQIVSEEINRSFKYNFLDVVCNPKVKYGRRAIIDGTDWYKEGAIGVEYATYPTSKCQYCDDDITCYVNAKRTFDFFAAVYRDVLLAGSIGESEEALVLPEFNFRLSSKADWCPEKEKRLKQVMENYEKA